MQHPPGPPVFAALWVLPSELLYFIWAYKIFMKPSLHLFSFSKPWPPALCSGFGAEGSWQPGVSARAPSVFLAELTQLRAFQHHTGLICALRENKKNHTKKQNKTKNQHQTNEKKKKKRKCANLGQQLHQRTLIKPYQKSLLIHASLMDTTMLSAESHPPRVLLADILVRGGSALVAQPTRLGTITAWLSWHKSPETL